MSNETFSVIFKHCVKVQEIEVVLILLFMGKKKFKPWRFEVWENKQTSVGEIMKKLKKARADKIVLTWSSHQCFLQNKHNKDYRVLL